jgi:DNA-binding NtrC family response regulator
MGSPPAGFTILIADRNPRVRDFLKREMTREGYRVHLAESAAELLHGAVHLDPLDLIIVDPDFPGAAAPGWLDSLKRERPAVPVVIHTHYVTTGVETAECRIEKDCLVVEKGGSSVEKLKQLASEVAGRSRKGSGEPAGAA